MMFGFSYNGVHSSEFEGLYVKTVEFPLLSPRNLTRTWIPGRPGALISDGEPDNKVLEFLCTLIVNHLEKRRQISRDIAAWLCKSGVLTLDYEADKSYEVLRAVSDVSIRSEGSFDTFVIRFECEPYQYGLYHEISGVGTQILPHFGTASAETLIRLRGDGLITLGGASCRISKVLGRVHLDSKRMLVYSDTKENLSRCLDGSFLRVPPRGGTLVCGEGISEFTIQYRDTWL